MIKTILISVALIVTSFADSLVSVDVDAFGKALGGWNARRKKAADYEMTEVKYRTYRPIVTETPAGGIYISLRIDYRRGHFSSDDHALLQVTLDPKGKLTSLESSIHSQGKSIKSDLITTTGVKASAVLSRDPVVNAGMTLVKDLTAKMNQEDKAEPGRVIFPAVIIHNYNKLMRSIVVADPPPPKAEIVFPDDEREGE